MQVKKNSSYQNKIEKELAKLSYAISPMTYIQFQAKLDDNGQIPTTIIGGEEFVPTRFYYGWRICDLCGHDPIKRVYVIKSKTSGHEAHIGCECARNYIAADIIDGLSKLFDLEYNKIVNPIKHEEGAAALEWAVKNNVSLPRNLSGLMIEGISSKYQLTNNGMPNVVLRKIKEGKNILKGDKLVMQVWTEIHKNAPILDALNVLDTYNEKLGVGIRRLEKIDQLNVTYRVPMQEIRSLAIKHLDLVTESDERVLARLDECYTNFYTWEIPQLVSRILNILRRYDAPKPIVTAPAVVQPAQQLQKIVTKEQVTDKGLIDAVFIRIAAAGVTDNYFVNSVHKWYNTKGQMSVKQYEALERVAKKAEEKKAA